MKKLAFLIQQIGREGSPERQIADLKMSKIIAPACKAEGYDLKRADDFDEPAILEPITSALSRSSLVIADLGSSPWNQNVLVESGFRLATGRPIVFTADEEPQPHQLPVHLQNKRILKLRRGNDYHEDIRSLRERIQIQEKDTSSWSSDYPVIEFFIDLDNRTRSRFTQVNEAAANLYGLESAEELLTTSIPRADTRLRSYMHAAHSRSFKQNQDALMGQALRFDGERSPLMATVPAWINEKHPFEEFQDQIYWPVLLQHKYAKEEGGILLRVAFLNLTSWNCQNPDSRDPSTILHLPDIFRSRQFDQDVFLSYNNTDYETAQYLQNIFSSAGISVWFDRDSLNTTRNLRPELLRKVRRSQMLVALLGTDGFGETQEAAELNPMLSDILGEKKPFFLLVSHALHSDDKQEKWKNRLPLAWRELIRDKPFALLPRHDELREQANKPNGPFMRQLVRVILQSSRNSNAEHEIHC